MSRYTAISDVGSAIVELLRENMTPEPIINPASIDICTPNEKGDILLGLYLYDIQEDENLRITTKSSLDLNRQKYPPVLLSLYYMVTAYSASDVKFRAADDHKILGKAIQVFHDNSTLQIKNDLSDDTSVFSEAKIELIRNDMDEKIKIWSFPNLPYRLSVCYKVSPVEIESLRTKQISRVLDMEVRINK